MKLCKCGCGQVVTWNKDKRRWNKYIKGHAWNKGKSWDEQFSPSVKKMSLERMKNNNPLVLYWNAQPKEDYIEHQRKAGRLGYKKQIELYPNIHIKNAYKTRQIIRKNKPYILDGVSFDSNEERECAKLLPIDKLIEGVNCHVRVNNIEIDFYLEDQNLFVEYHPWDWNGRTKEEYQAKRKDIISNSKYKNTSLVVLESLKETKEMFE